MVDNMDKKKEASKNYLYIHHPETTIWCLSMQTVFLGVFHISVDVAIYMHIHTHIYVLCNLPFSPSFPESTILK